MLNSDMCLFKAITFGGSQEGGEPTCDFDSCAASPTADIAQEYSENNGQFLTECDACCFAQQSLYEVAS